MVLPSLPLINNLAETTRRPVGNECARIIPRTTIRKTRRFNGISTERLVLTGFPTERFRMFGFAMTGSDHPIAIFGIGLQAEQ